MLYICYHISLCVGQCYVTVFPNPTSSLKEQGIKLVLDLSPLLPPGWEAEARI